MFFVDKPYISEFFKATVRDNAIPVVGTDIAQKMNLYSGTNIITEERAIEIVKELDNPTIYTTSENSYHWISKHLHFSDIPEKIELFKNKLKFRKLTQSIFPNFYFREIPKKDLKRIEFDKIPLPFVIKPTIGIESQKIYKVSSYSEWLKTIDLITKEIAPTRNLYPECVLNTNSFMIEEYIDGEEFAVDAYYNSIGEPVILGIFKHLFSSANSFSDRVYCSSKEIIESNLDEFTNFLEKIGNLARVKNFPVHIELRRNNNGILLPIEVNPIRFGGFCTTAELSFLAYGINPYLYFYYQKKPDWYKVIQGQERKLFSMVILDNSSGKNVSEITLFNYDKLLENFEKPIELRRIDYKQYPIFGILFIETIEENFMEIKNIIDSDLSEFITVNR
ncbi:MAG: ATP-grasp domain-containing protein [Okeania sp. SIO3B5]|uniref:ATP-grasp domain-containing protein n=1 Tax=Okeania sp. SIO3B5 TaxID=2607811 RepID=UPI001400FD71|nr:ATP-grasp domain-containing protein [Okeania sp. SIO3B5]NEO51827.1 ATP-grasp domain-containing protein [Okeania sp. SIO3B5]